MRNQFKWVNFAEKVEVTFLFFPRLPCCHIANSATELAVENAVSIHEFICGINGTTFYVFCIVCTFFSTVNCIIWFIL